MLTKNNRINKFIEVLIFIAIALLLYKVDFSIDYNTEFYFKKEDIYYEYEAAKQILTNENPYNKIIGSDMLENDKYATQLPLYYRFLAVIRENSNNNFSGFLENFRLILYFAQLTGGIFIYLMFKRHNKPLIGLGGALFYMFNVWTLNSIIYLKQDVLAIGLLLASFYYLDTKNFRWLSYVLFGLSLGIKYIGIFAVPIYLMPLLTKEDLPKKFIVNFLILVAVILLPSIQFIVANPNSFMRSILFSVTRAPLESEIIYGYKDLLVKSAMSYRHEAIVEKIVPRIPLFIAMGVSLMLLFTKKISNHTYLFLSLLVFTIFNPVIFPQYITWIPPFALLPLLDKER